MRKGMSFTLTMIIVAIVLLIAAVTITGIGSGFFSDFSGFLDAGAPEDTELIRQNCLDKKVTVCAQETITGTDWASQVTVQDRSCREWADQEDVFGPDGTADIPPC